MTKKRQNEDEPSRAEKALTLVSVAVTLALLGYLGYEAWQAPQGADPQVRVVGVETVEGGGVLVRLEFHNAGGIGLLSVTVEVDCAEPPPTIEYTNVPVADRREGRVLCPPGTTAPKASVSSYVEA